MIPDLPAPREAPTSFARALIIVFGQGYGLIGIAFAAFIVWRAADELVTSLLPASLAASVTVPRVLLVNLPMSFVYTLIVTIASLVIAFGVRSVDSGQPIDLRDGFAAFRLNWRPLLGLVAFWVVAQEIVGDILLAPQMIAMMTGHQDLALRLNSVFVYPVVIGIKLVMMSALWSLLSIAFARMSFVRAVTDGVVGPWKQGVRTAVLVAAYVALPSVGVQIREWLHYAIEWAKSRPASLSISALDKVHWILGDVVDALVLTVLIALLVVIFIDRSDQTNFETSQPQVIGGQASAR